ncbi:SUN domain-containing protein 3-like [Anopheles maculipalpis]|uniref:SUN domain-containing protein 3-like n=1 Tax=Anopheles maculipalpis TaxID=1496333 RepID=UPI002158C02D|nr:SUN domain-containing protein 3-like [Anopheles maculipalpis]
MSETHQKYLPVYVLCILLVCFTLFQVFVGENASENELHSRKLIEERLEQKQYQGLPNEVSIDTASNVQCFKELVELNDRITLLEQLNFDKLGPADYASSIFGGEVVSVATSSRHQNSIMSRVSSMLSSVSDNYSQMQCIIQDCGTCYALEGSSGTIVLKLAKNVHLNAITIEHIPKSSLPIKTDVYSALKEFSVWGSHNSGSTKKEIYFGTFTFDYMTTFLETFEFDLDRSVSIVRFVRIDIHSNYGEKYTCIYRIRIHGTPE